MKKRYLLVMVMVLLLITSMALIVACDNKDKDPIDDGGSGIIDDGGNNGGDNGSNNGGDEASGLADISQYLTYELNEDGNSYTVTGLTEEGELKARYTVGSDYSREIEEWYSLEIPAQYQGKPVTSIADYAFYGVSLAEVNIPDSVENIGGGAFFETGLTSVTIPQSVTAIGQMAFPILMFEVNNKSNLDIVFVPDFESVTTINPNYIYTYSIVDDNSESKLSIDDGYVIYNRNYNNKEYNMLVKYIGKDKDLILPNGITEIYQNAFFWSKIQSVVIPDSVTYIYPDAFNCPSLISVTIGSGVTNIDGGAFNNKYYFGLGGTSVGCPNLIEICNKSSLDIVAGSEEHGGIGEYAKNVYTPENGQSKLNTSDGDYITYNDGENKILVKYIGSESELTIPNDITEINNLAFYYCKDLTSIYISNSVTKIGICAFYDCRNLTSIIIPDSVTSIGASAFEDCSSLTEITIPFVGANKDESGEPESFSYIFGGYVPRSLKNVKITGGTCIGDMAFAGCCSLTSITIPDSVTSIGNYAFNYCISLTSITIPDSVTSIGSEAFSNCISLTSITIPNSVTYIGSGAFIGCTSLTSITIPDSVTNIGEYAFGDCSSLTSITIPNGVTSIGYGAFYNCSSLTSITIPDSVTSIGSEAFSNCISLTSITIPNSVTSIGDWAFEGCSSLTTITIPNSVTSIGSDAFEGCHSLTTINFLGTKAQWKAIIKEDLWYYGILESCAIHCTDGDIVKE